MIVVILFAVWVASKLDKLPSRQRNQFFIWLGYMAGVLFLGLIEPHRVVYASFGIVVGGLWVAGELDRLCESGYPKIAKWLIGIGGFVVAFIIFEPWEWS